MTGPDSPTSSQPAATPAAGSLRGTAVSGARWGAISSLATFLFSLAQNIALSRLLAPYDFGLSGMIWTILGLAQLFADAGLSSVYFYRQQATRDEISSLFWLNAIMTSLLSLLLLASGPMLVWFNREPALGPLVPWAVASFFLAGLGTPLRTLTQRDMRFAALSVSELAGGGGALLVSVIVAMGGGGVYALLAASLASASIKLVWLLFALRTNFPIGLHFRWADIGELLQFGFYQLGERVANYLWSSIDYLLIGRMLGAGPLGYYRMAYETAVRPLSAINPIFNSVSYPLFAKKQNDPEAMRRGYTEMLSYIAFLVLPIMAGLTVTAPLAVTVIFGAKWQPAVPILQILCLLGALRSLQNPVGALLIARGFARTGFVSNVALLAMNAVLFPLALLYGGSFALEALAAAAGFTLLLSAILFWRPYYGDTIGLTAAEAMRTLARPVLFSLCMAGAVWGLLAVLPPGWPATGQLAIAVMAGAAVYSGLYLALDPAFVRRFLSLIRHRN